MYGGRDHLRTYWHDLLPSIVVGDVSGNKLMLGNRSCIRTGKPLAAGLSGQAAGPSEDDPTRTPDLRLRILVHLQ